MVPLWLVAATASGVATTTSAAAMLDVVDFIMMRHLSLHEARMQGQRVRLLLQRPAL